MTNNMITESEEKVVQYSNIFNENIQFSFIRDRMVNFDSILIKEDIPLGLTNGICEDSTILTGKHE